MNSESAAIEDPRDMDVAHLKRDPRDSSLPVPAGLITTLPLLPVAERPFFPRQVVTLMLDETHWRETIECVKKHPGMLLGIVMVKGASVDKTHTSDFHAHGTVARVGKVSIVNGHIQFMAEGIRRFRVTKFLTSRAPFTAQVDYSEPSQTKSEEATAYGTLITDTIEELLTFRTRHSGELKTFIARFSPQDSESFADFAANILTKDKHELQGVLATEAIIPRLERVLKLVRRELEVAKLRAQVKKRVDEKLSESQRRFILQIQLKEIQKELGIGPNDPSNDGDQFRKRLAGRDVPTQVQQRLDEELNKLSALDSISPEYAVTRNYLDWLTRLPWGKHTEDNIVLSHARDVLDADHYGLAEVKERIIEFLAVGAFKENIAGSILLLVGPPGVGKTSIGRSIATALERRFYRFSLGGMRDEAEIKGHRRTYIGAMPGKLIQAMKEVDVSNPVIMLDELDKIGSTYRGDPASALLEVLDPEQNADFLDHYLDVRFDLSKTLFVCTANQTDTIPPALLDRMEVINLSGYMYQEKIEIANRHLWPKLLDQAGVANTQITIADTVLKDIAERYAREAGVRNYEKQLSRIIRKSLVKLIETSTDSIHVDDAHLESYLGAPIFRVEPPRSDVGVVTGLAWTAMGGDTLTIEATRVHTNKHGFQLTGNLGEVMKESASIAYSYIVANLATLRGDAKHIEEAFVHLHVPHGATPKDGPSAGVTMATALLSLARRQPIQRKLAMSGELTLTGQVLSVGGIKEKVMAARRANVNELILPAGNRRDVDSLPQQLRENITIHFASNFQDIVSVAFTQPEDITLNHLVTRITAEATR